MYTAKEIAQYFLSKDKSRKTFTKELVTRNGRNFYAGNARLNKYLQLSQNVYIGMTGEKLFSDDLYAYDNGAVVPSVQSSYPILYASNFTPSIDDASVRKFLDNMYEILGDAPLDELIEISHEDDAWQEKSNNFFLADEKMDSMAYKDVYREQFKDVIDMLRDMN